MSKRISGPYLPNIEALVAAGINPKTGLPVKLDGCGNKERIKRQLEIIDRQDAINSGTWFNLPDSLNGRLIERILYFRGQGAFFKYDDRFYFLPYALHAPDGSTGIDVYGRYTGITPIPFNGTSTLEGKGKEKPWIRGLVLKPRYDVAMPEDFEDASIEELESYLEDSCVILKDYAEGLSQYVEPRAGINAPVIDIMSECFPFMRTALLNGTGVSGMRVQTEDEQTQVELASISVNKAALEGRKYIPIVGSIDFQTLTDGPIAKAEEYLLAMQSLDNYRLSLHGLQNGGIFLKQSHILEAEQQMNSGNVGLVLRDKVQIRQDFCNVVNSLWGLGIWYEPSETVLNVDTSGDGIAGSDEDGGTNMGGSDDEFDS